jgi:hypothetical protein
LAGVEGIELTHSCSNRSPDPTGSIWEFQQKLQSTLVRSLLKCRAFPILPSTSPKCLPKKGRWRRQRAAGQTNFVGFSKFRFVLFAKTVLLRVARRYQRNQALTNCCQLFRAARKQHDAFALCSGLSWSAGNYEADAEDHLGRDPGRPALAGCWSTAPTIAARTMSRSRTILSHF